METGRRLTVSLLQVVVIAAAAFGLWRLEFSPLPKGADFLLWPVVIVAGLSLVLEIVFRLQSASRIRGALGLPDEFRPRTALFLQMTTRSSRDAAWSALIVGLLVTLAETQPEPRTYHTFIVCAGLVLEVTTLVRTVSIPFPAVGLIFRFPWFRLLAFGVIYLLLQQGWAATYGFGDSALLPALAAALGASYLGSALMNAAEVSVRWVDPDMPTRVLAVESVKLIAALASAVSWALVGWGVLGTLPNISAAALDRWPALLSGSWVPLHVSRLFEARHLLMGFLMLLGFARRVPSVGGTEQGLVYRPLIKASSYGLAGYVAWLAAAKLAPLGHEYALLGAAIAGGLFMSAAAMVVRIFVSESGGVLASVAQWFSESTLRAFFFGVSLVLYGLLLRPLLYETLWFAPVYEWLVVLSFAAIPLNRLRKGVREEVAPQSARPAAWPNWSRHVQVSEERRDPRMDGLLLLQQRFIDTGEWGRVWNYLVGLMLRNQTPIERIPAVFEPMTRWGRDSAAPRLRPPKDRGVRAHRQAALAETMTRVEEVFSLPRGSLEKVDEAGLQEAAGPFLDLGKGPEKLAVTLTAAYWQQGAALGSAAVLWFPLMTLVDDPVADAGVGVRACLRKVFWNVFKRGAPRWDRERRQRMADGAASHLFGNGTLEDLPVVVLSRQATVYEARRGGPEHRLPRGGSIEVIEESETGIRVRPSEGQHSYFTLDRLERGPVLPADHLVMEQEGVTA